MNGTERQRQLAAVELTGLITLNSARERTQTGDSTEEPRRKSLPVLLESSQSETSAGASCPKYSRSTSRRATGDFSARRRRSLPVTTGRDIFSLIAPTEAEDPTDVVLPKYLIEDSDQDKADFIREAQEESFIQQRQDKSLLDVVLPMSHEDADQDAASKPHRTCRLVWTFFVSNLQLHAIIAILGLSIAMIVILLRGSQGDAAAAKRDSGHYSDLQAAGDHNTGLRDIESSVREYDEGDGNFPVNITSPQLQGNGQDAGLRDIESLVRGYIEEEIKRHPDILDHALLRDPLSIQGKALSETVKAEGAIDNVAMAVTTYVLWVLNYALFELDAGVWSTDYGGDDVCLWRGVQCDNHGNVAVLDLEGMDMEGELPPEVFLLRESLVWLSLKDNPLLGQNDMPALLDRMTKLNYINVCNTEYCGGDNAGAFCSSGAEKLVYSDFDCACCKPCDSGSIITQRLDNCVYVDR